ncbi:MAG TPA: nucleotidyltransferase family protein [Solirubrobacteraceae bacterium]|nr:nucleotidyltransferase family protein [Solirubrobacteraceae bacterium]
MRKLYGHRDRDRALDRVTAAYERTASQAQMRLSDGGIVLAGGNVMLGMSTAEAPIDLHGLRGRRDEILGYAANHGARNVRVFGSTARGETRNGSDVDLLVEMDPGRSLLDLVGLWQDLEDLLGAHVDVLSDGGVSPHLRERIYAEAVPL